MRGQSDRQAYTERERGGEGKPRELHPFWTFHERLMPKPSNLTWTQQRYPMDWSQKMLGKLVFSTFLLRISFLQFHSLPHSLNLSLFLPSLCVYAGYWHLLCGFFNFSTDCFITEYRVRFEVGVGVRYFNWKSTVHADSWLTPRVANSHQTECVSGKYLLGDSLSPPTHF